MAKHLSSDLIVLALAKHLCSEITQSAIRSLQNMDAALSGDDTELENAWEEVCVQVQYEESVDWDTYMKTMSLIVQGEVDRLKSFEQEAIWLQTPDGEDWDCEDPEDRDPYPAFRSDEISN